MKIGMWIFDTDNLILMELWPFELSHLSNSPHYRIQGLCNYFMIYLC